MRKILLFVYQHHERRKDERRKCVCAILLSSFGLRRWMKEEMYHHDPHDAASGPND